MKGEVRREELSPTYTRLPVATAGSEFAPIETALGDVPLCPVDVFRALRAGAKREPNGSLSQCNSYTSMLRRLQRLMAKTTIVKDGTERSIRSTQRGWPQSPTFLSRALTLRSSAQQLDRWDQLRGVGTSIKVQPV